MCVVRKTTHYTLLSAIRKLMATIKEIIRATKAANAANKIAATKHEDIVATEFEADISAYYTNVLQECEQFINRPNCVYKL